MVDYRREHGAPTGTIDAFTDLEAELKREKFRTKSSFTRIKSKVLFLIDQSENPGYRKIQDACIKMYSTVESAMDVMTRLSEFFRKIKEKQLNNKVMLEIEKLDDEYSTTYAAAQHYIHTQKEQSSESSEILKIDLLSQMNISDESETYKKGGGNVSQEVGIFNSYSSVCNSVPLKTSIKQTDSTNEYQKNATVFEAEPQQALNKDMSLQNEQYQEFHCPVVG